MIEERDATRTVVSTLVAAGAEDVKMGIAEDATAHIMDLMSKGLYGDPETAVIREYTTNAIDAHVEEGVNRPVEVTTPIGTFSDPYLTIEDFGTGLTRDDIRTIYSQYGASTKRATNDQVGMLGLGCKSGFALGDQFTVVSTKAGMTIMVSIERDEEGTGVMRVISEEQTGKPNGTKVIIPVAPRSVVTDKATRLFRWFKPGTVLLNGAEVDTVKADEKSLRLTDDLYVIDGQQSYVIMGNVPYPAEIEHGIPSGWTNRGHVYPKSIAAFVPIGSVSFPPSRESLLMNAKTKATIERVEADVARELDLVVQREVDAAPTPREAVQAMLKYSVELGRDDNNITYKGGAIPRKWEPASLMTISDGNGGDQKVKLLVTDNSDHKMSRADDRETLPIGWWEDSLVVYGYSRRGMSAPQKRKLIKFAADEGITCKRFVLSAAQPPADVVRYIGRDRVRKWEDVEAVVLPKTVTSSRNPYGRLPGSYDVYRGLSATEWTEAKRISNLPTNDPAYQASYYTGANDGYVSEHGVAGDAIDQSRPIFWVPVRSDSASRYIGLLAEEHRATGCYIVSLSANRVDKFCRIVPTAKTAKEGVKEAWEKASKTFTANDRLLLHIHDNGNASDLEELDETILKDPDLVAAIRLAKTDTTALRSRRQKYERVVDTSDLDTVTWSNPLERYPLFQNFYSYYGNRRSAGSKYSPDMHLYLNAKYAELKSNGGL